MEDLEYDKHAFLAQLGLSKDNLGCYRNGEWVGNGATQVSISPHSN